MTRSLKNVMADPFWVEKRRGYIHTCVGRLFYNKHGPNPAIFQRWVGSPLGCEDEDPECKSPSDRTMPRNFAVSIFRLRRTFAERHGSVLGILPRVQGGSSRPLLIDHASLHTYVVVLQGNPSCCKITCLQRSSSPPASSDP